MAKSNTILNNEYSLNIPRYIDTSTEEDIQDIEGHLKGGIPKRDVYGMMQELLTGKVRLVMD